MTRIVALSLLAVAVVAGCSEPSALPTNETDASTAAPVSMTGGTAVVLDESGEGHGDSVSCEDLLASGKPVVFDFTAVWCGPCKQLEPHLHTLAKEYAGRVVFAQVDFDENEALAQSLGIEGIPFVMIVKGGRAEAQLTGFDPGGSTVAEIKKTLDSLL